MSISKKRLLGIIGLFVILAAIPLTVFLSQQQQEIRQRAAEGSTISTCLTPANGSTVNPNNVTFNWSSVAGAPGYHFRLALREGNWSEVIITNDRVIPENSH